MLRIGDWLDGSLGGGRTPEKDRELPDRMEKIKSPAVMLSSFVSASSSL
jgi:hypothetical protein